MQLFVGAYSIASSEICVDPKYAVVVNFHATESN